MYSIVNSRNPNEIQDKKKPFKIKSTDTYQDPDKYFRFNIYYKISRS